MLRPVIEIRSRVFNSAPSLSRSVAVLAASILFSATAHAGPPYVTDDPEPVEFRHWEVYLAAQHLSSRDGASGSAPLVDLNYGAWPGLQLHIMGQLTYTRLNTGPAYYGPGDTEVGAKIRFVNESKWCPGWMLGRITDLRGSARFTSPRVRLIITQKARWVTYIRSY